MKRPILAAMLVLGVTMPSLAGADPITAFTLFGGNNTSVSSHTTVNGLIGSNGGVTLGTSVSAVSIKGGGALSGGSQMNIGPGGAITFNGDVHLAAGTHVTGDIDSGGNVILSNDVIVDGSIRAAGRVTIANKATVLGDVDAGVATGQAVSVANGATVGGAITRRPGTTATIGNKATVGSSVSGVPDAPAPYVDTVLPNRAAYSSGSSNRVLGANATLTLTPGSYNDIKLGANGVLNLSAGSYYFDTWDFGSNADINFNLAGGDVRLFFTGSVNIGNNMEAWLAGGDASGIYAETYGNWEVGTGGKWFGTIFGSGDASKVSFGNNTELTGALWATNEVSLGGGSTATYMLADYMTPHSSSDAAVPEPASLVLLGAGLAGIAARLRAVRSKNARA